jgi:hypothetical protein
MTMVEYDFELGVPHDNLPAMTIPDPVFIKGWLSEDGRQRLFDLSAGNMAKRQSLLCDAVERRLERTGQPTDPVTLTLTLTLTLTAEDFEA